MQFQYQPHCILRRCIAGSLPHIAIDTLFAILEWLMSLLTDF